MKEKNIKELKEKLEFLLESEKDSELQKYDNLLENKDVNINEIAKEIYAKRGIDYSKLNKGIFNKLINTITTLASVFQNRDSKTRNKMILEIIYTVVLLVLIKLPFDLVRDIGYDYINILSTNYTLEVLWHLLFLILYTITFICTFIVLIRNFNKKYTRV